MSDNITEKVLDVHKNDCYKSKLIGHYTKVGDLLKVKYIIKSKSLKNSSIALSTEFDILTTGITDFRTGNVWFKEILKAWDAVNKILSGDNHKDAGVFEHLVIQHIDTLIYLQIHSKDKKKIS